MPIVSRRKSEKIYLDLSPEVGPDTPIGELLGETIALVVLGEREGVYRVGIEAPKAFRWLWEEIRDREQ